MITQQYQHPRIKDLPTIGSLEVGAFFVRPSEASIPNPVRIKLTAEDVLVRHTHFGRWDLECSHAETLVVPVTVSGILEYTRITRRKDCPETDTTDQLIVREPPSEMVLEQISDIALNEPTVDQSNIITVRIDSDLIVRLTTSKGLSAGVLDFVPETLPVCRVKLVGSVDYTPLPGYYL